MFFGQFRSSKTFNSWVSAQHSFPLAQSLLFCPGITKGSSRCLKPVPMVDGPQRIHSPIMIHRMTQRMTHRSDRKWSKLSGRPTNRPGAPAIVTRLSGVMVPARQILQRWTVKKPTQKPHCKRPQGMNATQGYGAPPAANTRRNSCRLEWTSPLQCHSAKSARRIQDLTQRLWRRVLHIVVWGKLLGCALLFQNLQRGVPKQILQQSK